MIEQKVGEFTRRVTFSPAFDKRHSDPSKNYGVGALGMTFLLIGPHGAMQFMLSTGMYLPHVADEFGARGSSLGRGDGWDIGYHAREPQYEGQTVSQQDCCHIGGPCYYDGTSLGASEFFPEFLGGGDDAEWEMLEARYRDRFSATPEARDA